MLAWARGETFALVLYHKQRTRHSARERVGVWTRELIDAVLECGGTYYLPYQLHATREQFHRAYPRATEFFELKRKLDPQYRLRGALWDKYYANAPEAAATAQAAASASLFHQVYGDTRSADRFYTFLQNIFHLFPQDRFHALIRHALSQHQTDEAIYRVLQTGLPGITPPLSMLTYALPSLSEQKREMGRQTAQLLQGHGPLKDYVEIGTTGRYVRALQQQLSLSGKVTLVHDKPDLLTGGPSGAWTTSAARQLRQPQRLCATELARTQRRPRQLFRRTAPHGTRKTSPLSDVDRSGAATGGLFHRTRP